MRIGSLDTSTNVNTTAILTSMAARTIPRRGAENTCCAPVTAGVLDIDSAERLSRSFKALGDATRVRLLSIIAAAEGAEACICELTDPVNLSQPTVSHHMKVLTDAGLVTREQRGKWAYYRVVDDALDALSAAIAVPGIRV